MKEIKYVYIPGLRPTPMLAYYTDIKEEIYNEEYKNSYGDFTIEKNHMWNIGAYLIFDKETNKIISYKFNDVFHFIWLLRILNLPLEIKFNENFIKNNQDFFKNNLDEFGPLE